MKKKGKKRILVAMSGGVDSSLTAALLKEEGHDVLGVTMRVFDPRRCQEGEEKTCCSARDIGDARRVASSLDIPFTSLDVRRQFEDRVIDPFVQEYRRGRTPNPCVLCNSRVKFDLLLEKARSLGADFLATGHYARIEERGGALALCRGTDSEKDQSYFLFDVRLSALPHLIFPLGAMVKAEVRRRAADLGLAVAGKRESQEICFIPGGDYGAFLRDRLSSDAFPPGPIVDGEGRRLGSHRGLAFYTVGQRRGLGVAAGKPLYVTKIDTASNTLTLGDNDDLASRDCTVKAVNWLIGEGPREMKAMVKIRYRHRPAAAIVRRLEEGFHQVLFDEPQRAVTPGQGAVFYRDDMVLGGGWIESVQPH